MFTLSIYQIHKCDCTFHLFLFLSVQLKEGYEVRTIRHLRFCANYYTTLIVLLRLAQTSTSCSIDTTLKQFNSLILYYIDAM